MDKKFWDDRMARRARLSDEERKLDALEDIADSLAIIAERLDGIGGQ